MKSNVILSFSIMSMVIFSACQKEQTTFNSAFPNVDPELWSYYTTFENEASKRGFEYDLYALQISGEIEEIDEQNVAGSCRYGSNIHNAVTIDQTFWNNSNATFKEFVVFHELGHCVLLRDHDESQDARGRCLSIMRSGLTNCRDAYDLQTRDFYLDELFFE